MIPQEQIKRMYRYARTAIHSPDFCHDVMVILLQSDEEYIRDERAFFSCVASAYRRRRRQQLYSHAELWTRWKHETVPRDSMLNHPDEVIERQEDALQAYRLAHRLLDALRRPQDQELITRRWIEEQPKEQVMEEMQITATQYRNWQHRALREAAKVMVAPAPAYARGLLGRAAS